MRKGSNMVLDYLNSQLYTPGDHAPFPVRSHGRLETPRKSEDILFKGGAFLVAR